MTGHSRFRRPTATGLDLSPTFIVWYVGAVISLASIANDMLLTAFAAIEQDLGLETGEAGLMMAYFFLGSGLGQAFFGPLSDYIGRKPTILICSVFFLIGAAVVYISESLPMLLAGRLLQGIGCSMCQSVTRAILRDLYAGPELALQMARTFSVFAIGPVLMPLLGAWFLDYWNWQVILLGHAIAGALLLAATIFLFEETLLRPRLLSARRMLRQLRHYFSHRQSAFFTIPGILSYSMLILVLSLTPGFLMNGLGLSQWEFAIIFSICIGVAIVPGQYLNRWLIRRFHIWESSMALAIISVIGQGAILIWIGQKDIVGVYEMATAMFTFSFLALAQVGNFTSLCIDPHPRIAGFASSLLGLCNQSIGAVFCLLILNPLINYDPYRWLLVSLAVSIIAAALVGAGHRFLLSKPSDRRESPGPESQAR